MNNVSVYDLVYYVLRLLPKDKVTPELKRKILSDVVELLSDGWSYQDILTQFRAANKGNQFAMENTNDVNIVSMFSNRGKTRVNLLNPCRVYFHNEIRISPKPVVIEFDYDTGEVVRKNEEYFLEMKASYTIEDLMAYFLNKSNLYDNAIKTSTRLKGALEWLVRNYDLEHVLYMIDASNDRISFCNLEKLRNVMDIQEYYTEARETYQRRYNESKVNGDDKIVPKRRVL